MNIQGKLHIKQDTEVISDKFQKREFVVEYVDNNPQYPQLIKFQLVQDKCDYLDFHEIGSTVDVHFNIRGQQAKNGNYYNNLECWKLLKVNSEGGEQPF